MRSVWKVGISAEIKSGWHWDRMPFHFCGPAGTAEIACRKVKRAALRDDLRRPEVTSVERVGDLDFV